MQETYIERIRAVMQNKKKLERELNIKISNKGHNVFVSGKPEDEYLALEILEAIDLEFSPERALLLKEEDVILHKINIKDLTKRKDTREIKARIIGSKGRTLKTLCNLSDCVFSVHDNTIGIIGNAEDIQDGIQCIKSIIQGSKQANVYSRLEKRKKEKKLSNLLPIKNEFQARDIKRVINR